MTSPRIAIVGAGPAGLAAAVDAAQAGMDVTLLDEAPLPGGQIFRQSQQDYPSPSYAAWSETRRKAALLASFAECEAAVTYVPNAQVIAAFEGPELHHVVDEALHVTRPDAVILATGMREKIYPFEGWTLPGVMGAGAAQSILKTQGVLPGKRMVMAGAGPLPLVIAAQLSRAGADIKALAMLQGVTGFLKHPAALWAGRDVVAEGISYAATLMRKGIKSLTEYVPIRAEGKTQLEAVTLAKLGSDGVPVGAEITIEANVLALNYGFVAHVELAGMLGVELRHTDLTGWHPKVDPLGQTSVPGVFACGDGAGLRGSFVAQAEGALVGRAAAAFCDSRLGRATNSSANKTRARHTTFQTAVAQSLRLPKGIWTIAKPETVICRCEGVLRRDVDAALDQGHLSANAVKRNTRCGMGWCGGRSCLHVVENLVAQRTGDQPSTPMTPRPLARPVSLSALAAQPEGQGHAH